MANASVRFDRALRPWDGFGINYVAACQTRDYDEWPQDYGGFDLLSDRDRAAIVELIFGNDGLQPTIGKMFIDSLQAGLTKPACAASDPYTLVAAMYDHGRTTTWMRYFMREGLRLTSRRGDPFSILATLYGPPGWTTEQKVVRGRDLDPAEKYEIAKYMLSFVKFMRQREGLPVRYLSFFNEGDSDAAAKRWPEDGGDRPDMIGHDYNMYWPPAQVVDFLSFMPEMCRRLDVSKLSLCGGECTILNFANEYTQAILASPEARAGYGMFVSHGFGEHPAYSTDEPIAPLRRTDPDFRGWVTSATWGRDDWGDTSVRFSVKIHDHINLSKMNGYIPWAAVQRHSQWAGGDPNPRTAVLVTDKGTWEIQREYYIYKHWCPVGKAGMTVVEAASDNEEVRISAFGPGDTGRPEAIVMTNGGTTDHEISVGVGGNRASRFACVVTHGERTYAGGPEVAVDGNEIVVDLPAESIVTLKGIG